MALREFTDPDGMSWKVWDVLPTLHAAVARPGTILPEEVADGWLSFEAEGERRRFYPLPEGWECCTDTELGRLCRHAVVVSSGRSLSRFTGNDAAVSA